MSKKRKLFVPRYQKWENERSHSTKDILKEFSESMESPEIPIAQPPQGVDSSHFFPPQSKRAKRSAHHEEEEDKIDLTDEADTAMEQPMPSASCLTSRLSTSSHSASPAAATTTTGQMAKSTIALQIISKIKQVLDSPQQSPTSTRQKHNTATAQDSMLARAPIKQSRQSNLSLSGGLGRAAIGSQQRQPSSSPSRGRVERSFTPSMSNSLPALQSRRSDPSGSNVMSSLPGSKRLPSSKFTPGTLLTDMYDAPKSCPRLSGNGHQGTCTSRVAVLGKGRERTHSTKDILKEFSESMESPEIPIAQPPQATSQSAKYPLRDRDKHVRISKGRRMVESSDDDDLQLSPVKKKPATTAKNKKGSFYGTVGADTHFYQLLGLAAGKGSRNKTSKPNSVKNIRNLPVSKRTKWPAPHNENEVIDLTDEADTAMEQPMPAASCLTSRLSTSSHSASSAAAVTTAGEIANATLAVNYLSQARQALDSPHKSPAPTSQQPNTITLAVNFPSQARQALDSSQQSPASTYQQPNRITLAVNFPSQALDSAQQSPASTYQQPNMITLAVNWEDVGSPVQTYEMQTRSEGEQRETSSLADERILTSRRQNWKPSTLEAFQTTRKT